MQLSDGTQGYINSEHIMSTTGCKEGDIVKVATNSLPLLLREEPKPGATSLRSMPKGTYIIRLEENVANTGGIRWNKVKTFDGLVGYVSAEYLELIAKKQSEQTSMDKVTIDESQKLVKCEPNAKLGNLLAQNSGATIKDKDGNTITDTEKLLATGNLVTINGVEYKVAKLGDANGDGKINSADLLKIQKHLLNVVLLDNGATITASDANNDGKINSADLLKIQKYLLKVTNLEI